MPLAAFSSRVFGVFEVRDLHFDHSNWNRLRDRFIFKIILLRHILVGDTNLFLCERLNFNPFMRTFVNFTIYVFTWHDFT